MPTTHSELEISGRPWRITLTWSAGRDPVVVGVELKAMRAADGSRGEVTAQLLREIPIGRLAALHRPQPQPQEPSEGLMETPRTGRPALHSESHYRAVAEVYRAAVEAGEPPVHAVANHYSVTVGTARRWVHIARNRHGLLARVRRGQIG